MRLAFVLFKYFPFGGLQRDMLAIAEACARRGAAVTVFCREWKGPVPQPVRVETIAAGGLSNHERDREFYRLLGPRLLTFRPDRVVGFNKMPGLDVYYAADPCFRARHRLPLAWLTPRYAHYSNFERAVFGPRGTPCILLINPAEAPVYQRYYGTEDSRLVELPPGIARDRVLPPDWRERRARARAGLGIEPGQSLLLLVGSGFRTKGVDRAVRALAALDGDCLLLVAGRGRPRRYRRLARKLRVAERVRFAGGRDDVGELMLAADLLVHPARRENTGTALLEAMVAGLPVATTATCGYAGYVERYRMGVVVPRPFSQRAFDRAVTSLLATDSRDEFRERGKRFADNADIYDMPVVAASLIMEGWR